MTKLDQTPIIKWENCIALILLMKVSEILTLLRFDYIYDIYESLISLIELFNFVNTTN